MWPGIQDIEAQVALGSLYYFGNGVPKDSAEAFRWFRKAADQGHSDAQNVLGLMYYEGNGVPQDYMKAYVWFNIAAAYSQGDEREKAIKFRNEAAKKLTPEQLAQAQKISSEWKPK